MCNIPLTIPSHLEDTLVSAECRGNLLEGNTEEVRQTQPCDNAQAVNNAVNNCSSCGKKRRLQKCAKCYSAEYCGRECQKKHWKRHRKLCSALLKQCSILLTSTTKMIPKSRDLTCVNIHHYGLDEVGPSCSEPPPKDGKRFIVQVQTGYNNPFDFTSVTLTIYDRSLEIYGTFQSDYVQSLIRELGAICEKKYIEKKLFMWAAYTENNVIRLFTNDFPPYQRW